MPSAEDTKQCRLIEVKRNKELGIKEIIRFSSPLLTVSSQWTGCSHSSRFGQFELIIFNHSFLLFTVVFWLKWAPFFWLWYKEEKWQELKKRWGKQFTRVTKQPNSKLVSFCHNHGRLVILKRGSKLGKIHNWGGVRLLSGLTDCHWRSKHAVCLSFPSKITIMRIFWSNGSIGTFTFGSHRNDIQLFSDPPLLSETRASSYWAFTANSTERNNPPVMNTHTLNPC